MFIGHFALGFAAKRATPGISLAVLFVAAQLADLLWPLLVAAGIEQVRIDPGNTAFTPLDFMNYPYSHSLFFLLIWGVLFGVAYRRLAGEPKAFLVLAALVVSHWVLDVLMHRPDLPVYPGGAKVGLGLWNSVAATLVLELALYAAGLGIYVRATRAKDQIGRWGFASLAALLVVLYIVSYLGPPPPTVPALAGTALAGATVLTIWAWWADSHRDATGTAGGRS